MLESGFQGLGFNLWGGLGSRAGFRVKGLGFRV